MKWSGWIVVSLAAAVAVAAHAAEPRGVPARLARTSTSLTRFAEEPKAAADAAAPITPHAPVHYRQATWDIWSGTATGYVYAPGACDYTPPCVNHLWDGYEQRPLRCYGPQRHCHGMHGCGSCGGGGCGSCGAASSCGCGGGHCSLLKRAHGWHFGGRVSGCSSCSDIAPSCGAPTCAAPSCAAPSCGCEASGNRYDAPAPTPSDAPAPPAPKPVAGGEDPTVELPMLEKTTRGNRLRGFTWPDNSLQR